MYKFQRLLGVQLCCNLARVLWPPIGYILTLVSADIMFYISDRDRHLRSC